MRACSRQTRSLVSCQFSQYRVYATIQICCQVPGLNAKRPITGPLKPPVACSVAHHAFGSAMTLAIKLDDKPRRVNGKVRNIRTDRHLPAHMNSVCFAQLAKFHPKAPFAPGHSVSKRAGAPDGRFVHLARRHSRPPPLAPPRKGEGDGRPTLKKLAVRVDEPDPAPEPHSRCFSITSASFPLPLAGRGQGWGCAADPAAIAVALNAHGPRQTPLTGMPVRSTLRGAVSSFQVDRALLTAWNGSRLTNWPWPCCGITFPSSTATRPRVKV